MFFLLTLNTTKEGQSFTNSFPSLYVLISSSPRQLKSIHQKHYIWWIGWMYISICVWFVLLPSISFNLFHFLSNSFFQLHSFMFAVFFYYRFLVRSQVFASSSLYSSPLRSFSLSFSTLVLAHFKTLFQLHAHKHSITHTHSHTLVYTRSHTHSGSSERRIVHCGSRPCARTRQACSGRPVHGCWWLVVHWCWSGHGTFGLFVFVYVEILVSYSDVCLCRSHYHALHIITHIPHTNTYPSTSIHFAHPVTHP